ncbi:MAG: adenylate/guanylate cyclase domain-containing protein, partial [Bacteroidota bacterium]
LKLLSGQIGVSLENAKLYSTLEERVIERTKTIELQKQEIEKAKQSSDKLLLNILPENIADELKVNGKCKPRRHDEVTIMFTDFKGFTMMSESMSPEEIVEVVDHHYKKFDQIVKKYNVEKIKTIGDAYMCVSGLPEFNNQHAENAILAAKEMLEFVDEYVALRKEQQLPYCEMRVGIHTGPVVSGVVGSMKFAYDIWGVAVNTAARMESTSDPGKINISESTYNLVKDKFEFTYRGEVEAKHVGKLKMYYVEI